MAQLNLHPCVIQMDWHCSQRVDSDDWAAALGTFVAVLGTNCLTAGAALIGHIKGVARVAEVLCLRLSMVSTDQPVSIVGAIPAATNTLQATFTVLVYGLSGERLSGVIRATVEQTQTQWPGSIGFEILPGEVSYPRADHQQSGTLVT